MLIHELPHKYQKKIERLAARWGVSWDRMVYLIMDLGLEVLEAAAENQGDLPTVAPLPKPLPKPHPGRDPND